MYKKVTPEMERFIRSNCKLTSTALSGLIEKKFKIKISDRALDPYLTRFRSEADAANNAKVEAVREKILDDADKFANKYLKYLDDEIESLHALLEKNKDVKIESAKDRATISHALNQHLRTIIEFVKPEVNHDNLEICLSWGDSDKNETQVKPSSSPETDSQG
jgi:hypothetical protein